MYVPINVCVYDVYIGIPYGGTSRLLGTGLGGLGGFGALGSTMSNYYGSNNLTASLLAQSKFHSMELYSRQQQQNEICTPTSLLLMISKRILSVFLLLSRTTRFYHLNLNVIPHL